MISKVNYSKIITILQKINWINSKIVNNINKNYQDKVVKKMNLICHH